MLASARGRTSGLVELSWDGVGWNAADARRENFFCRRIGAFVSSPDPELVGRQGTRVGRLGEGRVPSR